MDMAAIARLLAEYVDAPVECDGFARLAHTALAEAEIEHSVLEGVVLAGDGSVALPIHYWIELRCGTLIDYRARLWLGESDAVPHGIFNQADFPQWRYEGARVDMPVLSPAFAKLLSTPILLD